jgi:hypothetical protein
MLEANGYLTRPQRFQCYRVTWQAARAVRDLTVPADHRDDDVAAGS